MERTKLTKRNRAGKSLPGSVWAGPLLIVAGLASLFFMARGVQPSPTRVPEHPAIRAVSALMGIALGALITANGMSKRREDARRWEAARRGPRTAWAVDYPWNPEGSSDETILDATLPISASLSALLLMAPYTVFAFSSPTATPVARLIMTGGNLMAACYLGYGGLLLARLRRFGRSSVAFATFPFFLGGPLEAEFRTSVDARTFDSLKVTLRCIEEVHPVQGMAVLECWQLWKSEQLVPQPMDPVKLKFELPEDPGFATRLASEEPRYWELEVTCVRPGLDFRATYLVPVYAPVPVKSR